MPIAGHVKGNIQTACIPVTVECYSGFKANERPLAFIFQGYRREISEIQDRWYEGGVAPDRPIVDYFKVKADAGPSCFHTLARGKIYSLKPDIHINVDF